MLDKRKYNFIVIVLMLLISTTNIQAQINQSPHSTLPFPKVLASDQAFMLNVAFQNSLVKFQWQIAPGCYLYKDRLHVFLVQKDLSKVSLMAHTKLPDALRIDDPSFGPEFIYKDQLTLPISLSDYVKEQSNLKLQVQYQGCAESGFCYPPVTKWFEATIANNQIQTLTPLPGAPQLASTPTKVESPKPSKGLMSLEGKSNFSIILSFYIVGILLTFTPCVLPMIPILFGVIVGESHLNTRKAFWLSLVYVLSMSFTYALAGIVFATLGKNLQALFQKPIAVFSFAALFFYLALVQLGVTRFHFPQRFQDMLTKLHHKQTSGSYISAAVMGILATLIASPCVSAPLLGALGYISQSGNIVLGGSALLAMGLGMGTLLLVVGTLEGKLLPKKGPWMHAVNQIFAIMMFGIGVWLLDRIIPHSITLALWGVILIFAAYCMGTFRKQSGYAGRAGFALVIYAFVLFWGTWHGEEDPMKPLLTGFWGDTEKQSSLFATIDSEQALTPILEAAKQQQRPLMLVFSAEWCTACKHLEHKVFTDASVQESLSHLTLIRADMSPYNETNQNLLQKFALVGPPAILFFDKNGRELTSYRIIGEVSPKEFLTHLNQVKKDSN